MECPSGIDPGARGEHYGMFGRIKLPRGALDVAAERALPTNEDSIAILVELRNESSDPVASEARIGCIAGALGCDSVRGSMRAGLHLEEIAERLVEFCCSGRPT